MEEKFMAWLNGFCSALSITDLYFNCGYSSADQEYFTEFGYKDIKTERKIAADDTFNYDEACATVKEQFDDFLEVIRNGDL